jgi:hypothetical protein
MHVCIALGAHEWWCVIYACMYPLLHAHTKFIKHFWFYRSFTNLYLRGMRVAVRDLIRIRLYYIFSIPWRYADTLYVLQRAHNITMVIRCSRTHNNYCLLLRGIHEKTILQGSLACLISYYHWSYAWMHVASGRSTPFHRKPGPSLGWQMKRGIMCDAGGKSLCLNFH